MKIIIDSPGIQKDCMDFEKYASMFSRIVEESPPRFTIGIFGEWGSGKTTLMDMIYDLLGKNDQFVPIKFNAWRYERDKHLMIPLLETIRLKLDHLAKENEEEKQKVKQISNVIKAIAKGFEGEFSFNIPLAAKAKIKLNPKEWFKKEDEQEDLSTYYQIVKHLAEIPKGPSLNPFVIFVDDLDRCFAPKALEIIESIKAFFDIDGYIFVLGLDVRALKAYIAQKYGESSRITAEEYIEKIIQLPFFIPPMNNQQLNTAIQSLSTDTKELEYLEKFSEGIPANIRKIKRLINSYRVIKSTTGAEIVSEVLMKLLILQFRWPDYYAELVDKKYPFYSDTLKYINGYDGDRVRFLKAYAPAEVPLLKPEDQEEYTAKMIEQKEFEQSIEWYEEIDTLLQNKQLWKYFDNFLSEGIDTHALDEYIHKSRTSYIEEPSQFESFEQKLQTKQGPFMS